MQDADIAARNPELERLDALVGEWKLESPFSADIHAKCVVEWLQGEKFLIQRWEVDHPEAPDGIAIIGFDADKGAYAQHYFDSRGVARVYEMSFDDGVWKLWRDSPGFSQRFAGTVSDDGNTIQGQWEISTDDSTWEPDFELTYRRVEEGLAGCRSSSGCDARSEARTQGVPIVFSIGATEDAASGRAARPGGSADISPNPPTTR